MKKSQLLAVVSAAVLLMSSAIAQDRPVTRSINVTGNGEISVAPDMAQVSLGVEMSGKTAKEAMDSTNAATAALLKRLADIGIPKEHIQTSRLTLQPVYETPQTPRGTAPRVIGYRAINMLSVRVENLERVGPVVDAVTASGGNRLQGISFGLKNDRDAKLRALAAASVSAREKAEALATALKITLGAILEVQEGGVQVVGQEMDMNFGRGMAEAAVAAPVSAGELRVTAFVTVRFLIAGA